ncbi:exodeoxyribonuclease III [soil metagenome]
MKILSYNVNGLRSAISKGFVDWLKATDADVVCLQEIKISDQQIDNTLFEDLGYHSYWMYADKKGYSGVAILSRIKPEKIVYGCDISKYDCEGRVLRADFTNHSVMSVYMPSGSSGEQRQVFKYEWLDDFYYYISDLKNEVPDLIISGDYNICHLPIDIHNPKSNKNSSGFLPEERAWISRFLYSGFIDTFRYFNQEPHNYTWWSYRFKAREKNLGWRIDYHMASESLKNRLKRASILCEAKHSDHCPVLLEID